MSCPFDSWKEARELRCDAPPCAGMTQIRFDGRRLRTFLSARLTGLPCSSTSIRRRAATSLSPCDGGCARACRSCRCQCLSARMTLRRALPVTQTSGVATRSSPMMFGSKRTSPPRPTYAPSGMESRHRRRRCRCPGHGCRCRRRRRRRFRCHRRSRSSRARQGRPSCHRCRPYRRRRSSRRRRRRCLQVPVRVQPCRQRYPRRARATSPSLRRPRPRHRRRHRGRSSSAAHRRARRVRAMRPFGTPLAGTHERGRADGAAAELRRDLVDRAFGVAPVLVGVPEHRRRSPRRAGARRARR